MEKLIISMKNSTVATWEKDEWDDYHYDGKCVVIKKNGEWVGIYNMDCVICVVVK